MKQFYLFATIILLFSGCSTIENLKEGMTSQKFDHQKYKDDKFEGGQADQPFDCEQYVARQLGQRGVKQKAESFLGVGSALHPKPSGWEKCYRTVKRHYDY
jgi:hypothetical protein